MMKALCGAGLILWWTRSTQGLWLWKSRWYLSSRLRIFAQYTSFLSLYFDWSLHFFLAVYLHWACVHFILCYHSSVVALVHFSLYIFDMRYLIYFHLLFIFWGVHPLLKLSGSTRKPPPRLYRMIPADRMIVILLMQAPSFSPVRCWAPSS